MSNLIKPYNEHYMNCYLNNLFSIIVTQNPEKKTSSYINAYNYSIVKTLDNFNYLQLDYTDNFYSSVYEKIFKKKCKSPFNIFNQPLGTELKNTYKNIDNILGVIKNNIVFMVVDLFFFDNGNIFFSKIHREHILMVVDWNPETKTFTIIDDGNKGYGYYSINYITMSTLIKHCKKAYCFKKDYIKYDTEKKNKKKIIDYKEIQYNSKRICNQIKSIDDSFYKLNFPKNYSELCQLLIFIQRCYNRQICNNLLLNNYIDNILDDSICKDFFTEKNKVLKSNWYNLRAIILRNIATNKTIEFETIFNNILLYLKKELEFWEQFNKIN